MQKLLISAIAINWCTQKTELNENAINVAIDTQHATKVIIYLTTFADELRTKTVSLNFHPQILMNIFV